MLPTLCALNWPRGKLSARKQALKRGIPACADAAPFAHWNGVERGRSNAYSRVALFEKVLLPGDSGRAEEKFWIRELRGIESAKILILGHHGSQTATSKVLLEKLRSIRMAIASARFARYGHPHAKVEKSLQKKRVPLLRTEDWGTIRLEL